MFTKLSTIVAAIIITTVPAIAEDPAPELVDQIQIPSIDSRLSTVSLSAALSTTHASMRDACAERDALTKTVIEDRVTFETMNAATTDRMMTFNVWRAKRRHEESAANLAEAESTCRTAIDQFIHEQTARLDPKQRVMAQD